MNKDNTEEKLLLEYLCLEGLKKIGKDKDQRYFKRLKHEFDRIIEKEYQNYFLAVWDFVNWAKSNNIWVGPCRGSAGASLLSYCLGITNIDPIEHDLLFLRFLSSIRSDFPDIDLDFADNRRDEVFEYLEKIYGADHTSKIATYARFHPKGILNDIGRIFEIPRWEINKINSLVIERSGGDARASFALIDTFEEFKEAKDFKNKYPLASEIAIALEGMIRHKSSHAAAMILSGKEIFNFSPINKIGGVICCEWEKQLCEDINLIKFDILGLKTLTILKDACDSAMVELPKTFDDKAIYENIFRDSNTIGVFQFQTVGMQKFCSQLNISNFDELSDATTLFRPGSLHSGQAQVYANRKNGLEEVKCFHPLLEEITKKTQGTILYQEQIMRIFHEIGALSWSTSEMARKVITKSKGKDAFEKMRKEFVNNAIKINKLTEEDAEKLYDTVSTFGSYSFNKTHAYGYSMISYYCAWLKFYYPQHFYKALLKYESDQAEIKNYIQDAKRNNICFEFPEINISSLNYEIYKNRIYAGLNSVNGIADKTAKKIIENRPYLSFEDFKKRCKVSEKIITGLIIADAFRKFEINKKEEINKIKKNKIESNLNDYSEVELSQLIYQNTTLQPEIDISKSFNFGKLDFVKISDLEDHKGLRIILRGIVTAVIKKDKLLRNNLKNHKFKFEQRLLYLNLTDGSDNVAVQVGPETFELYEKELQEIKNKPVIIFGTASKDGKKIDADFIEIIDPLITCRNELEKLFDKCKLLDNNEAYLFSAKPAVSKNGKSYYKVCLNNGISALCFQFEKKLCPGMKVKYFINKDPFINLKVIT